MGWDPRNLHQLVIHVQYDHPYFGQLFLGGILELIGYPNMYYSGDNMHSIEMLHFIPRIIMGILAVVDTFLLYCILQIRYNRTVALISAILFAVMPMTWILRRVYLDTLLMPFLLTSILFALYVQKSRNENSRAMYFRRDYSVFVLLSGIFLGLTIYTKIPAITFIPLVGYIIYLNSRKVRILLIWLVPVILIPCIWPLYSVIAGQSDLWVQWVLWQTERDKPLGRSLNSFFQIDPIITVGGVAGLILAASQEGFFSSNLDSPFYSFLVSNRICPIFSFDCDIPNFLHCVRNTDRFGSRKNKKTLENILQYNNYFYIDFWSCDHHHTYHPECKFC